MNNAYKNMRGFWLDVQNLETKKGIKGIGKDEILIAGLEFCMKDHEGKLKNILLAASVLGNASIYFENNSPSGIGGMVGENLEAVHKAADKFLTESAAMAPQMMPCDALPEPTDPSKVTLFAINKDKTFYIELNELAARNTENPFYKFYAYSQQLISAFRQKEETPKK